MWVHCRGLALLDKEGNPIRLAGSHADISKRKQAFFELEKTNRELDQFAYVASHDLKAPLRAIANLSQWIEEDLGTVMTEETKKQMNLLRGRVSRMEGLINGILEYSRAGRVDMKIEKVDINELINEVIEAIDNRGVEIIYSPDMPVLETARLPLSQVFLNLLNNAIKYNDKSEGRIKISVEKISIDTDSENTITAEKQDIYSVTPGRYFKFVIEDNGPGIAPEDHEKIFKVFQTLHARDTIESTGVGLALVKKIITELGGMVGVESEVGFGAKFYFIIPEKIHASDKGSFQAQVA